MSPRTSAKRSYRRRVRSSKCRGHVAAACRAMSKCKYSSGKKRSFCRKGKNTRRRRRRQRGGISSDADAAKLASSVSHDKSYTGPPLGMRHAGGSRRRSRRTLRGGQSLFTEGPSHKFFTYSGHGNNAYKKD